ncbi:flagellar hook-associated protein FlgL [Photobacterium sanguinicancri]|uniref:Flagellar hook-associated protein 3 n=1 Tax=Photobacterium sanguinicancri TaxID=875932 RepID=A0AAW7Y994_9GAMM|nr:flagellar hook-associated protein FlgL [Photobacterium sanguinicancri]KXI24135.1 flagellar biosynthesis protein FlgL [Photobacterium sanguinicancri]MDO6543557.1 flagellar hook-associated protein FlgL [Photobacterium sanguinicancri]OZS45648.1 flagellar hook-associated protein 3 [Photobacterium sanguinicancri]
MITRMATFHNYRSVANDMNRQQVKVAENQQQLASGKRLLTAGDDPVSSIYIQNFDQQNTQIDQSLKSITMARNRLNNEETAVAEVENLLDEAKRKSMLMVNGSLSADDRIAHKQDMQGLYDSFMNVVNSQDESGNFVFAGTRYNKQPFFRDNNGVVAYAGDSYQRMAKVSASVDVPINDAGDKLFLEVANPYGDYQPDYDLKSGSLLLLSNATNTNNADKAAYDVTFTNTAAGTNYELFQNGVSVQQGKYEADTGIQWGTLQVDLEGEIKDGDKISLNRQEHVNVFEAFRRGIELSDSSVSDASASAELHQVAAELSEGFKHINRVRSEVGTRLQTLDRQEDMHQDFKIVMSEARGTLEDLDYPSAVIELNENMMSLQASQQAFAKTKDLNLFNYI